MALPLFPTLPGVAWPFVVTPVWSTLKQEAISGRETRIGLWSYPRRRYETSFDLLRQAQSEWQTLVGFYNQVGGSRDVFQFNDVNDNIVTGQSFGTGDGITTSFQLVRALGGFIEPVTSVNGAPTVKVNGTTTAVTINASGMVTFGSAPGSGAALTWSGNYYWLCRFDEDTASFSNFVNGAWEVKQLAFTTVKL